MEFFQESTPLKLIPFCLENQTTEYTVETVTSQVNNPDVATTSSSEPQAHPLPDFSPHSQGSEPEVTAYAESVVRRMELIKESGQTSTEPPADSMGRLHLEP